MSNTSTPLDLDEGASDEELAQRKKAANAERTAIEDIKWLMSSPRGRRIFWWLLDIAGVFRTSFPCDANMAFREGGRNIGLQLQAKVVDHCPDEYIATLTEHKD